MGVSGSGKTTTGSQLAQRLRWDFYDADDFHPAENIHKMSAGIPLNDEDRVPWLEALNRMLVECTNNGRPGVLSCSALKEKYRQALLKGTQGVQLVYLKGDYNLLNKRLEARQGHYMKAALLKSQLDILEEPQNALVMDIALPLEEILTQIAAHIQKTDPPGEQ